MNGRDIDWDNWRPVASPPGDFLGCRICGALIERVAKQWMTAAEAKGEVAKDIRVDVVRYEHTEQIEVIYNPVLTHQAWHREVERR